MNRIFITLLFLAYTLSGASEALQTSARHLTKQNGLTDNRVTVLEQDHHGYIWAGTDNGLNRISGHDIYTWESPEHPLHNIHVRAIETDETDNCLWIFTPQGMVGCLDLAQNELIAHTPEKSDSLLHLHHKGRLYMWQYGPTQRCVRTRLNKGRLITQTFKKEVSDICTDEEGGDWLLTKRGLYLNGFEEKLPGSDSVTHITTYRNICLAVTPHEVLAYNHSRRIVRRTPFPHAYRNASQCINLATWGDQILLFTPDRVITYHILDATFSAPANCQLKNGQIVSQSDNHIYAYDDRGKFLRFGDEGKTTPLQLIPAEAARKLDKKVPQISIMDATTEVIAIYGNGVHILNTETGKSNHLHQEDSHNFVRDNRIHDLLTDHTGCLWIATEHAGIICLLPSRKDGAQDSLHVRNAPQTHISLVAVDGEKCLTSTDEMGLSYTHNNIEWHFSSLAYDQLDAVQYQYYLTTLDSTWQSPTHNHKAIYKNLAPGQYQFHVRASFDGIHWGREAIHTIVIGEPWWSQWPAYLVTLAIFVAMGLFLYLIVHRFIHPERATNDERQTEQSSTPSTETLPNTAEQSAFVSEESSPKAEQPPLTAKDERFKQQLEKILEEHIEDSDFGVEEFAACVNLKRTQFYTKVKRITGLSPIELLRKAHLEHAAHLLKETDLNIDEVRERCGFSNSTTFYNYFKQQYGMTPRQYRNQA